MKILIGTCKVTKLVTIRNDKIKTSKNKKFPRSWGQKTTTVQTLVKKDEN